MRVAWKAPASTVWIVYEGLGRQMFIILARTLLTVRTVGPTFLCFVCDFLNLVFTYLCPLILHFIKFVYHYVFVIPWSLQLNNLRYGWRLKSLKSLFLFYLLLSFCCCYFLLICSLFSYSKFWEAFNTFLILYNFFRFPWSLGQIYRRCRFC